MKNEFKTSRLILLIIFLSIVVRLFFLHPSFSDESFYFNVAKNIAENKLPYKDFFFSHPPVQVYLLALLFKIFGASFLVGKILTLLTSSLSVLIIYLILKELYDKKTAFVAAIIFLITPVFLSFSLIGYGMWEAMLFVLVSTYLMVKNKPLLSSMMFLLAIFTRYLAIIYLPFLIALVFLRKQKIQNFLIPLSIAFFSSTFILMLVFGNDYFNQTISYHLTSKVSGQFTQTAQYFAIGPFFIFLAAISAFVAYTKKDKILLLLALVLLIADAIILLSFKLYFYHYFLISLPFCIMATARALVVSRDLIIRIPILVIIFLSIFFNYQTIDFYLNPAHARKFYQIAELVNMETIKDDKIFGEPVMTNYISLVTGREISGDYLDSYLPHLTFEGEEKVINHLKDDKPKFFLEMKLKNNYYYLNNQYFRELIQNNYEIRAEFEGTPYYFVYQHS